jgi:hypothetical protein
MGPAGLAKRLAKRAKPVDLVLIDQAKTGRPSSHRALTWALGAVRFQCRVKVSATVPGDVPAAGQFLV